MSIGRKSPEEKEAAAAAMRARYAEKKRIERSIRAKAYHAQFDSARAGSDLTDRTPDPLTRPVQPTIDARLERDPKFVEAVREEEIASFTESSAPLILAARSQSEHISEKMKDHLQQASAIAVAAKKERKALGLGINSGKIYKSSAELIRKFLEDGRKGAVNAKGQTRLIQMIEKMYEVATGSGQKNVQAFEALMARAYGKPKPSDEALDALAKGGVQIVYVAPPELPEAQREQFKPVPNFIEGEVVDND